MKFLFCIIINFFIFSAVSKNCSKEDYETAEFWNNYYDPEEVYKVGLKIQDEVQRIKLEIKRSIISSSFDNENIRKIITDEFIELAKVHFK